MYPLQGPTVSCTLIVSRSLDHRTTSQNQLGSRELPMNVQWVVFPLDWSLNYIVLLYGCGPAPYTLFADTHSWLLFTRTGQDLVRLFLQLSVHSSCDRVEWCRLQTMRGVFLPLGEWFWILPTVGSGCPVSSVHILQHLSLVCTWGNSGVRHLLLCMGCWLMIVFTRVYPSLETLESLPVWG